MRSPTRESAQSIPISQEVISKALRERALRSLSSTVTTRPKLEAWCRKTYHRPLPEILEAVRQDGLIQIRRASFEQLKKSATVITQQYNRFLPPVKPDDDGSRAAIEALTAAVSLPEEEVREVFS